MGQALSDPSLACSIIAQIPITATNMFPGNLAETIPPSNCQFSFLFFLMEEVIYQWKESECLHSIDQERRGSPWEKASQKAEWAASFLFHPLTSLRGWGCHLFAHITPCLHCFIDLCLQLAFNGHLFYVACPGNIRINRIESLRCFIYVMVGGGGMARHTRARKCHRVARCCSRALQCSHTGELNSLIFRSRRDCLFCLVDS